MIINKLIIFSESKCPSIEFDVVQCQTTVCVSYCISSTGGTHHTQVRVTLMTQLCCLLSKGWEWKPSDSVIYRINI